MQNDSTINSEEKKIRIVLAEDHRILRHGLKALLEGCQDMDVVGEAEEGQEAIRVIEKCRPDIVLLDINMPKMDGISVIKDIKKRFPDTKIIALTMHKKEEYIFESFRSGAEGYCLKSLSFEELLWAIRVVNSGKNYVSPEISEKVLDSYLKTKKKTMKKAFWENLVRRQKEIALEPVKGQEKTH